MTVSAQALELLRHHEGVRLRPYQCPALLWTIGVGHVIDPEHLRIKYNERRYLPIPEGWDRKITMEEANAILSQDLEHFARGVERLCGRGLTGNRLDALVSFSFNLGLGNLQRSTVRIKHNRGDYLGAADAFLLWTKAAGRELLGLVRRRRDERAVYLGAC